MLIDISRTITPQLAVWTGDTPFSYVHNLRQADGYSVNLTTMTLSAHTGTHADAPYHFQDGGAHPAQLPLERYVGRARVIEVARREGGILPADLSASVQGAERVLLKTWVSDVPDTVFPTDFPYPTLELIEYLAQQAIVLLGVDMPSVDAYTSKTLDCHHRLLARGMAHLETLALAGVRAGDYELIALPLKLDGVCGSPVRAVPRAL